VLTTSLAASFLGQTLTGRDLAAVGAILAGVLCVIYSKVSEDARRCGRQHREQCT
jgi:drug/metabolite transporter (DMT)-like permease